MSDFDFDEIDKAVADALTPDTPESASSSVHDETVQPEPAKTTPVESKQEKPAPKTAPAARRSSGRFMDVVHPSSDMRSQPSSSAFTPPNRTSQDSTQSEAETTIDDKQSSAIETPLDSPFLPDAKVEKRPLGAFALAAQDTETTDDEKLETTPVPEEELLLEEPDEPRLEAHIMPDPIDFAAHATALPSENEDTGNLTMDEEQKEPVSPEKEPVILEEIEQSGTQEDAVATVEKEPESEPVKQVDSEPIGPASISQQYTEQPSSAPSSGAIYDTETYHKPLAPVVKKRSGVWTFIWILLLIILGAGAGVAFYLFILPMF